MNYRNSPGEYFQAYIEDAIKAAESVNPQALARIVGMIEIRRRTGAVIWVAGNGGSAANASHLQCHLVDGGCRAICLTDNAPLFTARANDMGYNDSMLQSVPSNGVRPEELVIALSTSGDSPNVARLVEHAPHSVALLGHSRHSRIAQKATEVLHVDNDMPQIVEDIHSAVIHMIYYALTDSL